MVYGCRAVALPCQISDNPRSQGDLPYLLLCSASVVKLVDAPDSKSGSERSVGSIPTRGTKE